LDENAIKSHLLKSELKVPEQSSYNYDSDEDKAEFHTGTALRSVEVTARRMSNGIIEVAQVAHKRGSDLVNVDSWRTLAFGMLVCSLVGFSFSALFHENYRGRGGNAGTVIVNNAHSPEETQQLLADVLRNRCIMNSTFCPQIPRKIFVDDWAHMHADFTVKPRCYDESREYDDICTSNCEVLFRKLSNETESFRRVTIACQVGCAYAKREKAAKTMTSASPNCQFDCRNTVWVSFPGKQKCNYDRGLGLVTTEFEKKYGSGVFGVGKACELGCILGNSRPCPKCDQDAHVTQYPA